MAITEWKIGRDTVSQRVIEVIICDDDPILLEDLQQDLNRIFSKLNITAKIKAFKNPNEISEKQLSSVDMAFLDIDFDNEYLNGIDVAKSLRRTNQDCLIFFITNFIDYAPAGYEVRAFRYILKKDRADVLERYILQGFEQLAEKQEYLSLRDQDLIIKLPLDQIEYLEVMDHYVSIHADTRRFVLSSTLSNLENALEPHGFLRIHKSFLVNMAYIRKFRSRECILTTGTILAVGEKSYPAQKQKFLHWKGMS